MFPTTQTNITDLSTALQQNKVNKTQNNSGKSYLRFDFKTGDFTYGIDKVDITGERLAVNVASFVHGWILWSGGQASKVMRSFTETLPEPMPAAGSDTPSEARGFEARFTDEDDSILVYETNSYGGRTGVDKLLEEVVSKVNQGSTFIFPVVELNSNNYKSKQGGIIHNPQFDVVQWMDQEGNTEEPLEIEEKEEVQEAPRKRRRA